MRPSRTSSRYRARILAVAVVAGCGYLATRAVRGEHGSLEAAVHAATELPAVWIDRAATALVEPVLEVFQREQLHARIGELEGRLAELELAAAELREAELENQRLTTLLGLRERTAYRGRAARVIDADPPGRMRSIVIDAGADVGVVDNAPVIAADGLVGRVVKVHDRTAVVQLVVDASAGVGVIDERSRVQGVLIGSGGATSGLRYVPNLEDVRPGDRIVASGLDGIYPQGMLVGVVDEVHPGADAFKVVVVAVAVNLARLETVFVLGAGPAAGDNVAAPRLARALEARP